MTDLVFFYNVSAKDKQQDKGIDKLDNSQQDLSNKVEVRLAEQNFRHVKTIIRIIFSEKNILTSEKKSM